MKRLTKELERKIPTQTFTFHQLGGTVLTVHASNLISALELLTDLVADRTLWSMPPEAGYGSGTVGTFLEEMLALVGPI